MLRWSLRHPRFTLGACAVAGGGIYYVTTAESRIKQTPYRPLSGGSPRYYTRADLLVGEAAKPSTAASSADKDNVVWVPPSRTEMIALLEGKSDVPEGSEVLVDYPAGPTETKRRIVEVVDPIHGGQGQNETAPKKNNEFDLVVIGGGATGVGVALDAATRGLKVALLERDDFACGTSSRSTKLVHGGVRYLEKAVQDLDIEQYHLVVEALAERASFLRCAPYLSKEQALITPIYEWWKLPYLWAGCKVYDLLAGSRALTLSYFMTPAATVRSFPTIKRNGLWGSMVLYDGQHNDSRTNVALALTAASWGAVVANGVEVVGLNKSKDTGKIISVKARDVESGKTFTINTKGVINATGPFTDGVRKLDEPSTKNIVVPAAGTHVVLPQHFGNREFGILNPKTSDGRVIFFIPWQGAMIAGTTDTMVDISKDPQPTAKEVEWILRELQNQLDVKVTHDDILSVWSGIRPLVKDPSKEDIKGTAGIVRNHLLHLSPSNLLTISGGKWTTYRRMAEETVDRAIEVFNLKQAPHAVKAGTESVMLVGSARWSPKMPFLLMQAARGAIDERTAEHLSSDYGDRALVVLELAMRSYAASSSSSSSSVEDSSNKSKAQPLLLNKIHPEHPYIQAEIVHALRNEWARTATDFIARRTRLAFVDTRAARESLDTVVRVMGDAAGWDYKRRAAEREEALRWLDRNTTVDSAKQVVQGGEMATSKGKLWGGVIGHGEGRKEE